MKPDNKSKNSKVKSIVLGIFLLIYIPSLIHWVYGKNIKTELLKIGVIEETVNADACIIRDEKVLISPFEGRFVPELSEGERVPVNFRIATVLKESSVKLLEEKKDMELRIIKHQSTKSYNEIIFSGDIEKIDKSIKGIVNEIVATSNMNTLYNMERIYGEIDELIKKKASILGGLDTEDAYVNSIKKEKEKIEKQIELNTRDIYTQTAGIVSYKLDGYEEVLSPEVFEELTPDVLKNIIESDEEYSAEDNYASVDKPFAKIIKGNYGYIAAAFDAFERKGFELDSKIMLRLNDISKDVYGSIVHMSDIINDKFIIVARIDRSISETSTYRKLNVDFVKSFCEGLKVPLKCLKNINLTDKEAEIVMVEANYAKFRKVKIEGMNKEYAIISSEDKKVSLYGTYILNSENIEEGQMISK